MSRVLVIWQKDYVQSAWMESWSRVTCNNILVQKILLQLFHINLRGHTTCKSTIMDQGLIQRGVKNNIHIIFPHTWLIQFLSLLLNQHHVENMSCTDRNSLYRGIWITVAWNQLCIRCIILPYSYNVCPCSNRSSKQLKQPRKYKKWRTLGLQTDHHVALSPGHLGVPYNMC